MYSSAISNVASSRPGRPAAALRPKVAARLSFWLPLVVMGIAVFLVDHSFRYASSRNWENGAMVDLVAEAGSSNPARQLSFIAIGTMGAVLLLRRSQQPIALNKGVLLLVVLLFTLIVVSPLWADDPVQSLKRVMIPFLTMTAALGVAKHWRPRQFCYFAASVTSVLLFVGIAAACADGSLLPTDDFRFAGTLHPNSQGLNCAMLCLASLALFFKPANANAARRNWLWLAPFCWGLVFLLLTRSRTATMALAAGCLMLLLVGATFRTRMFALGSVAFLSCFFAVLLLAPDSNVGLVLDMVRMGRAQDSGDIASLTGRIPIWEKALSDVAARPVIGYGYGGFWTPRHVWDYLQVVEWEISHAHNAYIETMLGLGIVGLTIGFLAITSTIWSAMRNYRETQDIGYGFIAAVLVFALLHGLLDANFVAESFAALLAMICVAFIVLQGGRASRHVTTITQPSVPMLGRSKAATSRL